MDTRTAGPELSAAARSRFARPIPDFASLNPGYACWVVPVFADMNWTVLRNAWSQADAAPVQDSGGN